MKIVEITKDYILIMKIQSGDTAAYERLIKKYYQSIFNYCARRFNGDIVLAADLTQDVFLKLVENLHQFRFKGKFKNFLFAIAVSTCTNYYKKKKPVLEDIETLSIQDNAPDMLEQTIQSEQATEIQDAINRLPDIQKEAIILRFYHDFKVKDIAKITGVGQSTAQSRLKQGIDKLKFILDKEVL
ncbi:MAG: RNA polymerase sigma factor [Anaerolineaceae bacterium]